MPNTRGQMVIFFHGFQEPNKITLRKAPFHAGYDQTITPLCYTSRYSHIARDRRLATCEEIRYFEESLFLGELLATAEGVGRNALIY
jgi:hypothetical protein